VKTPNVVSHVCICGKHRKNTSLTQRAFDCKQKMFQHAKLLEHSPENRETVEGISQFAMLL
jgi:hypothetical protein